MLSKFHIGFMDKNLAKTCIKSKNSKNWYFNQVLLIWNILIHKTPGQLVNFFGMKLKILLNL